MIAVLISVGCGGAQQPQPDPSCVSWYDRLIGRADHTLCDRGEISRFEIQVTEWRMDCPEVARGEEGEALAVKISAADRCADDKTRTESLTMECDEKLKLAEEGTDCLGEACVKYTRFLKRVHAECDTPLLQGRYTDRIAALKPLFEERTTEVDRLVSLNRLTLTCGDYAEVPTTRKAREATRKVSRAVTETACIVERPPQGSQLETFRNEAIETCDDVLMNAYEKMVRRVSKKLDSRRVQKSRKRKQKLIGRILQMRTRFTEQGWSHLFPKTDRVFHATIEKYGEPEATKVDIVTSEGDARAQPFVSKSSDAIISPDDAPLDKEPDVVEIKEEPAIRAKPDAPKLETEEMVFGRAADAPQKRVEPNLSAGESRKHAPEPTDAAAPNEVDLRDAGPFAPKPRTAVTASSGGPIADNPYGEAAPLRPRDQTDPRQRRRDRQKLRVARKKCSALNRKVDQCDRKIEAYARRGNNAKVDAYGRKRAQTKQKLDALMAEIVQILTRDTLSKEELDAARNHLERSGCLP